MPSCPVKAPRVWLIHGFNVRDGGERTVGTLRPFLEGAGYEVKRFRYGWKGLLGVRFGNDNLARIIADIVDPGDHVIGHSNGACLAKLAADHGAQFGHMVLINPALDADTTFAPSIRKISIWHSPSDGPVKFGALLPWHNWGDMGAIGYRGPYDPRVASFNKENGFPVSSSKHSDIFTERCLSYFAPLIVNSLQS